MKKEHKTLIDEFFSLSPYEFTLLGNVLAYIIAATLNNAQQNSLGNLFELMAQVLLTIQAQSNITGANIKNEDLDVLINMLKSGSTSKQNIINLLNKIKNSP